MLVPASWMKQATAIPGFGSGVYALCPTSALSASGTTAVVEQFVELAALAVEEG